MTRRQVVSTPCQIAVLQREDKAPLSAYLLLTAQIMFQTTPTVYLTSIVGSRSSDGQPSAVQSAVAAAPTTKPFGAVESLSGLLISLCTSDWAEFFSMKKKLSDFAALEVCTEAARLLAKNSRSFRLLAVISHPEFFSDWEEIDAKHQVALFGGLALHSLNKNMKECAFHRVAKALRKDCLSQQNVSKPTKLRLRDCHTLIGQFMHDYALISDVNRAIVLAALAEGEQSGCGHLPSQQSVALMKKLGRV